MRGRQPGLGDPRGHGWWQARTGLAKCAWDGAGATGSVFWLFFTAGGSLFPACPTTYTSPATILLCGGAATPTGLSKDPRLSRARPFPAPRSPVPDPALCVSPQVERLCSGISNSHQHQGHQVSQLKSPLLLPQDSLLLFPPGAHVSARVRGLWGLLGGCPTPRTAPEEWPGRL